MRTNGVSLGKRQVENLARHAAMDMGEFYSARRPESCSEAVLA